MYGEHYSPSERQPSYVGSSPHVRGALREAMSNAKQPGIIPACTGSTNPARKQIAKLMGSSPHVRGAPNLVAQDGDRSGIIPACTGSTYPLYVQELTCEDHPRMYGEHEPL